MDWGRMDMLQWPLPRCLASFFLCARVRRPARGGTGGSRCVSCQGKAQTAAVRIHAQASRGSATPPWREGRHVRHLRHFHAQPLTGHHTRATPCRTNSIWPTYRLSPPWPSCRAFALRPNPSTCRSRPSAAASTSSSRPWACACSTAARAASRSPPWGATLRARRGCGSMGSGGGGAIACVPWAVYYFLPQVVKRYHERFPKIRVKVHDASANEVLVAVAQGEADFGLNFIGSQEAEIEFKPVLVERFVAACRRDPVLARRKQVTWADLGQHDYMSVGKTSGNRLLMDLALANVPDRPQCLYEAKHVTTLLGLVEAGLGVAAVPGLAMPGREHPTLVSIALVEPVVTRQMGLIKRRGRSLSPAAQQLYELLAATRSARLRNGPARQKIQSAR